jgi:hypothetical protein
MSKTFDATRRGGYDMTSPNIIYELTDDPVARYVDLFHSVFPAVKQHVDDHK